MKTSITALYKNMKVNFNHISNIFLKEIGNFITSKKKSSKKRILRVNIRPVLYEKFKTNQFV